MKTSASVAAANFIESKKRRKLGSECVVLPEPKSKSKFRWLFLLIFLLPLCFMRSDNRITGFAVQKGKNLLNYRLIFESEEGKRYVCHTDSCGDFSIQIPDGTYTVYIEKEKKKIKSPSILKCNSDRKFRVQF